MSAKSPSAFQRYPNATISPSLEHIDGAIQRALVAMDSTSTTAPTCRINKYVLLDLVNIARLALTAAALRAQSEGQP